MFSLSKIRPTKFQCSKIGKDYYLSSNACLIFLVKKKGHYHLLVETISCIYDLYPELNLKTPKFIKECKSISNKLQIINIWITTDLVSVHKILYQTYIECTHYTEIKTKVNSLLMKEYSKYHEELNSTLDELTRKYSNTEIWCNYKLLGLCNVILLFKAKVSNTTPNQLNVLDTRIQDCVSKIAKSFVIPNNQYGLGKIELHGCELIDVDIKFITNFIGIANISSLDLSNNCITDKSINTLTKFIIKNETINTILLNDNQLSSHTAKLFKKILKTTKLKNINLLNNNFSFKDLYLLRHNFLKNKNYTRIKENVQKGVQQGLQLNWPKKRRIKFADVLEMYNCSLLNFGQCYYIYSMIENYKKIYKNHSITITKWLKSLLINSVLLEDTLLKFNQNNELIEPLVQDYFKLIKKKLNKLKKQQALQQALYNIFNRILNDLQNMQAPFLFNGSQIIIDQKQRKFIGQSNSSGFKKAQLLNKKGLIVKYNLDPVFRQQNENEAKMMWKLRNKRILPVYGVCISLNQYHIVIPEMPETLRNHLHENKQQRLVKRCKIAIEIAKVIYHLHKNKALHRDLKTTNIFLNKNINIKLGDFGEAKFYDDIEIPTTNDKTFSPCHGTAWYIDPNILRIYLNNKGRKSSIPVPYTNKSDIYSLGVILCELFNLEGKTPYEYNVTNEEIVKRRPKIEKYYPKTLQKLIKKCWEEDPKKRPGIKRVLDDLKDIYKEVQIIDLRYFIQTKNSENIQCLLDEDVLRNCGHKNRESLLQEAFKLKSSDYYSIALLLLNDMQDKRISKIIDCNILRIAANRYIEMLKERINIKENDPKSYALQVSHLVPIECLCFNIKIYFNLLGKTYDEILYEAMDKKILPLSFLMLVQKSLNIVQQFYKYKKKFPKDDQATLFMRQFKLNKGIIAKGLINHLLNIMEELLKRIDLYKNSVQIQLMRRSLQYVVEQYSEKRWKWQYYNLVKIKTVKKVDSFNLLSSGCGNREFKKLFISTKGSNVNKYCIVESDIIQDSSRKAYYLPLELVNSWFNQQGGLKLCLCRSTPYKFTFKKSEFIIDVGDDNVKEISLLKRKYTICILTSLLDGSSIIPGTALYLQYDNNTITRRRKYWAWITSTLPNNNLVASLKQGEFLKLKEINYKDYMQLFLLSMIIYYLRGDHMVNSVMPCSLNNSEEKEKFFARYTIYMFYNASKILSAKVLDKFLSLDKTRILEKFREMIMTINNFYKSIFKDGMRYDIRQGRLDEIINLSEEDLSNIAKWLEIMMQNANKIFLEEQNYWYFIFNFKFDNQNKINHCNNINSFIGLMHLIKQEKYQKVFTFFNKCAKLYPNNAYCVASKIIYACMDLDIFVGVYQDKQTPIDIIKNLKPKIRKCICKIMQTRNLGKLVKKQLWTWVYSSRKDKKLARIAAISIALLNLAGESFANKKLEKTKIPQTYLPRAVFYNANLRETDLTKAVLPGACMIGSELQGSKMINVSIVTVPVSEKQNNLKKFSGLINNLKDVQRHPDFSRKLFAIVVKGEYAKKIFIREEILQRSVEIRQLETKVKEYELEGHEKCVTDAKWFPSKKKQILASAGKDNKIILWKYNNENYDIIAKLCEHEKIINELDWHPSSKLRILVSASTDGKIKMIKFYNDRFQNYNVKTFNEPKNHIKCVRLHANSQRLTLAAGCTDNKYNRVFVWLQQDNMNYKRWVLDGLWHKNRNKTKSITSVNWHSNANLKFLIAGSMDGTVYVWNLMGNSPECVYRLTFKPAIKFVSFSNCGNYLDVILIDNKSTGKFVTFRSYDDANITYAKGLGRYSNTFYHLYERGACEFQESNLITAIETLIPKFLLQIIRKMDKGWLAKVNIKDVSKNIFINSLRIIFNEVQYREKNMLISSLRNIFSFYPTPRIYQKTVLKQMQDKRNIAASLQFYGGFLRTNKLNRLNEVDFLKILYKIMIKKNNEKLPRYISYLFKEFKASLTSNKKKKSIEKKNTSFFAKIPCSIM